MSAETTPSTTHVQEVLKTRARALARRPAGSGADVAALDVIEFRLARERYAVAREYVQEVCPLKELTPLPCTPPFVLGIVNVRGQILPVLDVKKFFDLPETGITDLHMIIVVHVGEMEVGILADSVVGARSIPLTAIQESLPTLTGIRAQYLRGVTDQHMVILDAARILGDPKIIINEEVEV
jgi:purine-binding chemotaxis protein CheW